MKLSRDPAQARAIGIKYYFKCCVSRGMTPRAEGSTFHSTSAPARAQTHAHVPPSTTRKWQSKSCQARNVCSLLGQAPACGNSSLCYNGSVESLNLSHRCTIIPALGEFSQENRISLTCIRTQRHRRSFQAYRGVLQRPIIVPVPLSRHFYRWPVFPGEFTPFLEPQAR